MKNKVFFIVFVLIILYSSSVFATDNILVVDTSVVGSDLGVVDCTPLMRTGNGSSDSYMQSFTSSVIWLESNNVYVSFSSGKYYYDSNSGWVYSTSNTTGVVIDSSGNLYGVLGGSSIDEVVYLDSDKDINCNALYSNTDISTLLAYTGVNSNNTTFFNNAFNYNSGSGGGDSGGGDSGGGSSDSPQDYSNVLDHIDSQVTSTNTIITGIDSSVVDIQYTLADTYNLTENIDNSVTDIKDYLIGYNNDISNTITSTSQVTQNMIASQSEQQQNNFNTITNTTSYNSSDVVIDTSFNTIQDVNGVDNFIVRIYNVVYGFFNNLDTSLVVNVVIPIPFTDKSFTLSTSGLQNFYAQHTALSNLITISWYFVFGVYIFRLAYKFWLSSVTGSVFRDTEGFTADLDSDNLVKSLFL